jgi:hypothetical protein
MESISETFDGKVLKISNIEPAMVENVRNLLASNKERGVPLSKVKETFSNFNYKVEVEDVGAEVVTEAAEVGDVLITPEPAPVKKSKPAKKGKKTKATKKVKKATKSKSVSSGKKRGRQPNLEKQAKAFELIRSMLSDGKEAGAIVKAGMKLFKCSYPAFYYYINLYREQN